MNYKEFLEKFPDDKSTVDYFVNIRFPEGVVCPKCKRKEVKQRKENPKFYHCRLCNYSFSVFKDTIFEKTTTDLQKWFYANEMTFRWNHREIDSSFNIVLRNAIFI